MLRRPWIPFAVLLLFATPPAAAEVAFDFGGTLRYRAQAMSDFVLDADGTRQGQRSWGTARLRLEPEVRFTEDVILHANLQVLDGQIHGDQVDLGGDAVLEPWRETSRRDQHEVREAWLQVPIGIGHLRVGRMTSDWGMGLVANDGEDDDYGFGDATHGDIVNRALLIFSLFERDGGAEGDGRLLLTAGADLVEEDELTDRRGGDTAWQAIGALAWQEEAWQLGAYVAHRNLKRDDGTRIEATAVDLAGRWSGDLSERYGLEVGFEGVFITGTTDEFRFERAPDEQAIRQYGGVVAGGVTDRDTALRYGLEIGHASGDDDPQDGTLRALRFDPAYKAGLTLFQEVLARTSARGFERVTDPSLSAEPPRGIERSPTQGSITNATYLFPRIGWAPLDGRFVARLGALIAFAPADVVDPFASAEAGGFNRNPWGKAKADGLLGVEVDAGLDTFVKAGDLVVRIGVQYGVLQPGPALGAARGAAELGAVHKGRVVTDLRW